MKKKLSMFLGILMIISVFASCGSTDSVESSAEDKSEVISSEISDISEVSEKSSEEKSEEESEDMSSEETYGPVSVSLGKPYEVSVAPSDSYKDINNSQLTDGVYAPTSGVGYSNERFVGWLRSQFTVKIDLGEIKGNIYHFEGSFLQEASTGIGVPAAVKIAVSDNGNDWESIGKLTIPTAEESTTVVGTLTLDEKISCRYVEYTITPSTTWVFIDELSVCEYGLITNSSDNAAEIINAYASDTTKDSEKYSAFEKLVTGKTDTSKYRNNLAYGRSYTVNASALDNYKDTDKKLTDDVYGFSIEDGSWVCYTGKDEIEIILDLGSKQTSICGFEADVISALSLEASLPIYVTFSLSDDKKTWCEVARVYAPDKKQDSYKYTYESNVTLGGRYVKLTAKCAGNSNLLIDEFAVYEYGEQKADYNSVYGELELPVVTEKEYWATTDADYGQEINLAKGLSYQIACPLGIVCTDSDSNTSETSKLLTNGKKGNGVDIHNGTFCKFNGCSGRYIFFDLTKISSISKLVVGTLAKTDWAVNAPDSISVYLSLDGESWYTGIKYLVDKSKDSAIIRNEISLSSAVSARFVCVYVPVNVWCGIDEIEIYGSKDASVSKEVTSAGLEVYSALGWKSESNEWSERDETLLGGAKDVFLAYHSAKSGKTVSELLSVVAYLDSDGNIKDTMYDGVLFLMSGKFPSGQAGGTGGVLGYNKSDMLWLMNSLFEQNQNIDALDKATAQTKKALGLDSSYKVKYFVSLYFPSCSGDFGDIDGDGVSENADTFSGKIKILNWWIDLFESTRKTKSYENIEFCGYYWYNESIDSDQLEMLNATADKVHSYNSYFFWIPYFSASGWTNWQEFGFDTVCLQPNYAFDLSVPASRIESAVKAAMMNKMDIEIEMDGKAASDKRYRLKYYEYLKQGFKLGYQSHCMHLYYMGSSISSLVSAELYEVRQIYDYTYQFIKGTMVLSPEKADDFTVETSAETSVSGKLFKGIKDYYSYKVTLSPKHGSVTINADGTYTYYPNKGYTGSDSFGFAYSDNLDYSDSTIVTININ